MIFDIETVMAIVHKAKKKGQPEVERIEMLGDRVLVRRTKGADFKITKSKLWVPANAKKQDVGGVVVAKGSGLYNPERERYIPMDFEVGQFVLFGKYSGTDVRIEGQEYGVIRQDRILATVKGEAAGIEFN